MKSFLRNFFPVHKFLKNLDEGWSVVEMGKLPEFSHSQAISHCQ